MKTMRLTRDIPIFLAAVICFILISDYFIQPSIETGLGIPTTKWASILVGFAMIVGMVSVAKSHCVKLLNKKTSSFDKSMSLLLLVSLTVTLLTGIIVAPWASAFFQWDFNYIFNSMYTATFALLAFALLVAAYRHLKPKTIDAVGFLLPVILVTLRNMPIVSDNLPILGIVGDWILRIPVNGVSSALAMGTFIGSATFLVRMLVGRERRLIGGS